jgi:ribosomal protein L30/L7E
MVSHTEKLELVKSRQKRGSDTNQPALLPKVRDLLDVFGLVKVNSIRLLKKKKK